MRENLLPVIACPECKGPLQISKTISLIRYSTNTTEINEGVLTCRDCQTCYPIINKIPRLVPSREFLPDERADLQRFQSEAQTQVREIPEAVLDKEQRLQKIAEIVNAALLNREFASEKLRKRAEHDAEYRIYHSEDKDKFVKTAAPFLKTPPEVILDLGGGQGGTITCFKNFYKPRIAILVDLDITWAAIAKLRDYETEIIRANGAAMPLRADAIDLLVSTSALEHIPCWSNALDEIARVSKNAFIVWGPNKWFLYDWGHIDAPFVTFLPKALGRPVAYFYHWLRGTGRTYASIKAEMSVTFYISRGTVRRILSKKGQVYNVFPGFLHHSVNAGYHYIGGGAKTFMKNHPRLLRTLCRLTVAMGMEPMGNLVFIKKS